MIKITSTSEPELRKPDKWGSGHFGAPRGKRVHHGIDYQASKGSLVHSNVSGKVTKLGYPYADDLSYRYVQVTTEEGLDYRFFYLEPSVVISDLIATGDILGIVQDLGARYEGITPHFHFEVKHGNEYLDPADYF